MHISYDVARLVLENSPLSSCVALSETCQAFRSAFDQVEPLIESKVLEHVPWIAPSDTQSWADMARVVVARKRQANSSKNWLRATSDKSFCSDNYTISEPTKVTTQHNPSRAQLKSCDFDFDDIRLPYPYKRAMCKNGHISVREGEHNLDYRSHSIDIKNMSIVPTPCAKEKTPIRQLMAYGSESRDSFVSPVSGIKVVSATATPTGNRYPAGVVFYEDIIFINENDHVMIVAKRCLGSSRHEAFYVVKKDAKIEKNVLKFDFNHWKLSAMDPLVPPQLIGNTCWVSIVKKIGDSNWACLESAEKSNSDLIQVMKTSGRHFSVQTYNGLLWVYSSNRVFPIWLDLSEKRTLMFNYLVAEDKEKYLVCEVKPAFKKGWKAVGGWRTSRAIPCFSRSGSYITRGDFTKGGGYVVGNLETGESFACDKSYLNKNGKADFVFPSVSKSGVQFFSLPQIEGRNLINDLDDACENQTVDCKKETAYIQGRYDKMIVGDSYTDSEEDWEHVSDENSDNERAIEVLSRPVHIPDIHGDDDDDSDDDWENITRGGPPAFGTGFQFQFNFG